MQKRKNNIEEVDITYNGNTQQFQKFIQNVIREYVSEDKISPDNPAAADQQGILLERIRDKEHSDVYTQILKVCESDIKLF